MAAISSAAASKEQLRATIRPWLGVDDPHITIVGEGPGNPLSVFTLKNYCQAPVTEGRFSFYMLYVRPEDLSDANVERLLNASDKETNWVATGALAPGQAVSLNTFPGGAQQFSWHSAGLPPARVAGFMRVLLEYQGVDGSTHHTYVCFDLGWEPEPAKKVSTFCPYGSRMD